MMLKFSPRSVAKQLFVVGQLLGLDLRVHLTFFLLHGVVTLKPIKLTTKQVQPGNVCG